MRRLLVYALLLMSGGLATWLLPEPGLHLLSTRSATVRLEPIGYDLSYAVSWGLGMEQRFTLHADGAILSGTSSGWRKIWDKPYNAALSVYRSLDGNTYYFSTGWGPVHTFDVRSGTLRSDCLYPQPLKLTELGDRLVRLRGKGREVMDSADPGASDLWSYVETSGRGEIPEAPPGSRYYADLVYLGRFGVVPNARRRGRGEDVAFTPAGRTPEPRFGYAPNCG